MGVGMDNIMEFSLDIALALLLGATIFYCWLLNRRIQVLQDSKSELAGLLKQFDQSTKRAMHAMDVLQKASGEAAKSLQARIEKAQYVADDLDYMTDRANKAADQMEAGIAIARQRQKLEKTAPAATSEAPAKAKPSTSRVAAVPGWLPTQKTNGHGHSAHANGIEQFDGGAFRKTAVSNLATGASVDKNAMLDMQQMSSKSADRPPLNRDSVLASLRQAKSGGKGASSAISSLQSLIERVADRSQVEDGMDARQDRDERPIHFPANQSRGERELLKALQLQAD